MTPSILSFGAHPDDIEIGCGGTARKLIEKDYQIEHVYITSGEAGSQTIPKNKLRQIREQEASASAEVLGVRKIHFLRENDGFTQITESLRTKIINLIREIKPEKIFVHGSCDAFPDHRLVHQLVMSATAAAAGPWFQETTGTPWSVPEIYGYEVWCPMPQYQIALDITDTLEAKLTALRCFESQVGPTRYDEAFKGLSRYRGVMSWCGEYAEVFEVLKSSSTAFN